MHYAKISFALSQGFIEEMQGFGDENPSNHFELEGSYYFPIKFAQEKKTGVNYFLYIYEPLNFYFAKDYSLDLKEIEVYKRDNVFTMGGLTIASDGEECDFDRGLDIVSFEIVNTLP